MKKETITRVKLTASEGMVLTDGEHFGKEVFLAEDADSSKWHEITQEEYDKTMEQIERESEVHATDSI